MMRARDLKSRREPQGKAMKVLSINVARPRIIISQGQRISTGIFKQPVEGPVMLRRLNLDGDRQADLSVHGGPAKAVYAYPSEHYPLWQKELPDMDLPYGMFGENFTTEGLNEDNTNIGDRFRIGEAVVMVTQPREPCFKLAAKFGRDDIIKNFLESGRSGFYLAVVEEGMIESGQTIERIYRDENGVTVGDMNRLYLHGASDAALVRRALRVEALPSGYRDYLLQELQSLEQ
jgi:MOSC domain-containing protein YiiM